MTQRKFVYRLENAQGHGPYHGNQDCVGYLRPHHDPATMIVKIDLPKEILQALSKAGFVFGWRSKKLYGSFFKRSGQQHCKSLGFECRVYQPVFRFDFPDGQVLFSKDDISLSALPLLRDMLNLLNVRTKRNQAWSLSKIPWV